MDQPKIERMLRMTLSLFLLQANAPNVSNVPNSGNTHMAGGRDTLQGDSTPLPTKKKATHF